MSSGGSEGPRWRRVAEAEDAASSCIIHTGCGKCPAWRSDHYLLTAKCGLVCFMLYPGTSRTLSGQQAHVVHTGKRQCGHSVWPVECRGQKKVLPPHLSESTPVMSNWRGVDSSLDSSRPATEQPRLPFPQTGAVTAAACQDQDGVTGTSLPFCPTLCAHITFQQLSLRLGRWGHRWRLAAGRQNHSDARHGGMVGGERQGRKSRLHNTGDDDIPLQVISGSTACLEMVAEPTSPVFSDYSMSVFVCAEIMKNYSIFFFLKGMHHKPYQPRKYCDLSICSHWICPPRVKLRYSPSSSIMQEEWPRTPSS